MSLSFVKTPFAMVVSMAMVLMLGAQAVFEYAWLAPQAAVLTQLRQDIKDQQRKTLSQTATVSEPKARLDAILQRLQQQPASDARILRLHQLAALQGVLVRKASYKHQQQAGNIARLEVQTDLSGGYPAIRLFLHELLLQDEAAALESVEFSRPAGNVGVHAQVRLVFFSDL
jgi:Tfp pilus assembly protein PilO